MPDLERCPVEYLRDSVDIFNGFTIDPAFTAAALAAPRGQFTPLGGIYCEAVDDEIHVGIKTRINRLHKPDRPLREIAIADILLGENPGLRDHLPLFTLGVRDGAQIIGILTEDFSQGGEIPLQEEDFAIPVLVHGIDDMPSALHRDVFEALGGEYKIFPEAMNHMSAIACGRQVLIDFDDIGRERKDPLKSKLEAVSEFRDFAYVDLSQPQ